MQKVINMNNRLTYKIRDLINRNEYTDVTIKHKNDNEDIKISDANVKFRYEPKIDKAYLSFGNKDEYTVCEVEDSRINEVTIEKESLIIETNEKSYHCYIDKSKLYYQNKRIELVQKFTVTEGLKLENANIELNERGFIKVNETLETTTKNNM